MRNRRLLPLTVGNMGNGLTANGIAANGIAANGIAANGIAANGIAANGNALNAITANSKKDIVVTMIVETEISGYRLRIHSALERIS